MNAPQPGPDAATRRRNRNAMAGAARGRHRPGTVARWRRIVAVAGVLLLSLAVLLAWQSWRLVRMSGALGAAQHQVAALALELHQVRDDALTRRDADALRGQIGAAEQRVRTLEGGSAAHVVGAAAESVALIQGSFALRERGGGRLLRLMVAKGEVLRAPDGRPRLMMGGTGPVFAFRFAGTAFVVDRAGTLVTNRHVALPWEDGMPAAAMRQHGLEPMLLTMRGYLPGAPAPFNVTVLEADERHDLALLRGDGAARQAAPLPLATQPPAPGDAALLLGYPAGVRALLARAGDSTTEALRQRPDVDDDVAAEHLAQAGLVKPLASRGIVAQVAEDNVVYDAQTASGGSGGPVLNLRGEVVAVNRAVLAGFGGSNIGVAARRASELLAALAPPPDPMANP